MLSRWMCQLSSGGVVCGIKRTCQSRAEQSRTLWQEASSSLHEALGLHILTAGSVLLETRGETACSNYRVTIEGLEVGLRDRPVCVRPWVQCGAPQRSELAAAMELLSECQ